MGTKYSTLEKTNALKIAKGAVAVLAKAYGFTASDGPGAGPGIDNRKVLAVLGRITGEESIDMNTAYHTDPVWAVDAVLADPGFAPHYVGKNDSEVTREFVQKADALFCGVVRALLPQEPVPKDDYMVSERKILEEAATVLHMLFRLDLATQVEHVIEAHYANLPGLPPYRSSSTVKPHHPKCIQRCTYVNCAHHDGEVRSGDFDLATFKRVPNSWELERVEDPNASGPAIAVDGLTQKQTATSAETAKALADLTKALRDSGQPAK